MSVPTILVTGPVGAGKTSVVDEMSRMLRDRRIAHASVDFDALTECYPLPRDDDEWGNALGYENLAALWRNYARSGATRLLVAKVIHSRGDLEPLREAVPGAEIAVVRLRASIPTLQARVRRRDAGSGMQWHVDRAAVLAPLMDEWAPEDLLIDTDGVPLADVARDVLVRLDWIAR